MSNPTMPMPSLWEDARLGFTLIEEIRGNFYQDAPAPCGCYLGAAAAAAGAERLVIRRWARERYPWLAQPAANIPKLYRVLAAARQYCHGDWPMTQLRGQSWPPAYEAISLIHHTGFLNRMELSRLLASIDPYAPRGRYRLESQESQARAQGQEVAHVG